MIGNDEAPDDLSMLKRLDNEAEKLAEQLLNACVREMADLSFVADPGDQPLAKLSILVRACNKINDVAARVSAELKSRLTPEQTASFQARVAGLEQATKIEEVEQTIATKNSTTDEKKTWN